MSYEQDPRIPRLRVSRPVSACPRCRATKVKCDGKVPVCSACEKAGRSGDCSSANGYCAEGKNRNYVTLLEVRVKELEQQIRQIRVRQDAKEFGSSNASSTGISTRKSAESPDLCLKEAADVDDLVSDFGFLSVNATSRDFHGFTGEVSFIHLLRSTSSRKSLPKIVFRTLPPRYAVAPLIQHYLDNILMYCPCVTDMEIFRSVEMVYGEHGDHANANAMDHWIFRMIMGIAIISQSRTHGDSQSQTAVNHISIAFEYSEKVCRPGSVHGVQAILLLIIYSLYDPHQFNSWSLMGIAARVLVDLGLHQDPPADRLLHGPSLELRRRIFRCVYSLDRLISLAYLRPYSFTDESVSVQGPLEPEKAERGGRQPYLDSLKASLRPFELRRLYSPVFHKLFHSGRTFLYNPWSTVASYLSESQMIFSSLALNINDSLKSSLRIEMLFTNVVILSPHQQSDLGCDYSDALIFQYILEYAQIMVGMGEYRRRPTFFTYLEVLRTSFVAHRFLGLCERTCAVLATQEKIDPPPGISNDFLDQRTVLNSNISIFLKSIQCIRDLDESLEGVCSRFHLLDYSLRFRSKSLPILQNLSNALSHSEQISKPEIKSLDSTGY